MEVKDIDLNAEFEKLIKEAQNSTSYEALTGLSIHLCKFYYSLSSNKITIWL
ncbi:hypothetical protein [Thermodesulfobacterium hydrogeniphilum]|uniref:hypothetical protein n=1 Tax=Thermodesulfobacterium hydrogeniphilum TaxID=161156 RepID=UPI000ADE6684|nr:hypothetical protein [Thermodesulfobacterium hydrogeniphilum]